LKEFIRSVCVKYFLPPLRVFSHLVTRRRPIVVSKSSEWFIGIYRGRSPFELSDSPECGNPVLTGAHVTDVRAEFVADPFMVKDAGKWFMFFEVLNLNRQKGEIGMATSADAHHWQYRKIVLSEPFHLSYPLVFQWENNYYLVPESYEIGELRIYRARRFPDEWEFAGTLLKGVFADHSIFQHGYSWWLFANTEPLSGDNLRLFFADTPFGPWREHPKSPVVTNDGRVARPGGRTLVTGGQLIRFAQDCSPTYGRSVNAFIIRTLSRTDYLEEPFPGNPILSPGKSAWTMHGMHHVDAYEIGPDDWVACVDGYRRKLTTELQY